MDGMGWIIGLIVVGIVVYFAVRQMRRESVDDKTSGVIDTLEIPGMTLRLTPTHLIEGYGTGKQHPIANLVARVEEGGSVNRRFTVTRIAALGVFAAGVPKKIDDRQVYLTIEGPTTVIVHDIPVKKSPQIGTQARSFAAQINRSAGVAPQSGPTPAVSSPAPVATAETFESVAAKIRELAQLHRDGLLTDSEFETKKAQLLLRY